MLDAAAAGRERRSQRPHSRRAEAAGPGDLQAAQARLRSEGAQSLGEQGGLHAAGEVRDADGSADGVRQNQRQAACS